MERCEDRDGDGDGARAELTVATGDITQLPVDAIVNAANDRLLPGGGVCGAIHAAAGPGLAAECSRIGGCPTGGAVATSGYGLPARFVIHAVGPVWRGGDAGEAGLLASAYRSSVAVAREIGARSIAFPAISTGIYAYPAAQAAEVAVRAVLDATAGNRQPGRVVFCCFTPRSAELHRSALEQYGQLRQRD